MRRNHAFAIAALIIAFASNARSEVPLADVLRVIGKVTNAARPVGSALVIALNLHDFGATETYSSNDGMFSLPPLRSGVYRVIAVKQGFVPAIATVVPTHKDQRLTLKLDQEKGAKSSDLQQQIWEIRGSLPPDVLRELDNALASPVDQTASATPRFRGEMMSLTGVTDQTSNPSFAQTVLGVQSRIGDNWQLGFQGNVHRLDDPSDTTNVSTSAAAQTSVMAMELRSSATDSYKLATTNSWWRLRDGPLQQDSNPEADVRSHNFEWEHGDARVQVRYFAQQNLFKANPQGSDLLELSGNTLLYQTARSDVGVSVRVAQESMHAVGAAALRTADVGANASLAIVPSFVLHYGMNSRLGLEGSEWAPRTAVEWKVGKKTSLVGSFLYKVYDQAHGANNMPAVVGLSDDSSLLPRYSYSVGIVSGTEGHNRFSAVGSVTAVDSSLRVVLNDSAEQFWDGMYVDPGDLRRDVRVAYRHEFGNVFAVDVATAAGSATPTTRSLYNAPEKFYVSGDLQSTLVPLGTSLAFSYRHITQPRTGSPGYSSERVNVRMAQSLHLPIDLKLLLGLEMAKALNSPFLLDSVDANGSIKYLGGISVNF
jgi:hypothetical protein